MRTFLVTTVVTALMAAGCGPTAVVGHKHPSATTPVKLTVYQACERLLANVRHHRGIPDIPTLRYIADHVNRPRFAADARTAVRDIGHTGTARVALTLLRDDCAHAGVKIPAS